MGPESVLVGSAAYYRCGCSLIDTLDPAERRAAEAEMLADWQAHRDYLRDIWHGRAADPNAGSKWFRIERAPGPCWAERHFAAAETNPPSP